MLALAALTGAVLLAGQLASCGVHEASHALVGSALGWEVEAVSICPGEAEVTYRSTSASATVDALESAAGGLGGALALAVAYLFVVGRSRPLRSPWWWAVGLGLAAGIGAQLFVGAAETLGAVFDRDYTEVLDAQFGWSAAGLSMSMTATAGWHVWRWRDAWRAGPVAPRPSTG